MKKSILIGISGLPGSGKTRFARNLSSFFSKEQVLVFSSDNYYKSQDHIPLELRHETNFDHPDALDFDLMRLHIEALVSGNSVIAPVYDFVEHTRINQTVEMHSTPIIIIEGILLIAMEEIRKLMDIKVFIDVPPDICLIRKINRDMKQKQRGIDKIIDMHVKNVSDTSRAFVIPSKRYADVIVTGGGDNKHALNMFRLMMSELIQK